MQQLLLSFIFALLPNLPVQQIERASNLIDLGVSSIVPTADSLNGATTLCANIVDVNSNVVEAEQRIEQERLEQERLEQERLASQQAQAYNYNSGYSTGYSYTPQNSGIWTPSYGYANCDQNAVDQGGLWEWANGYFAAHNYTPEGRMIASTPSEVNIGGRTYVYDHTEYGSHDEPYIPEHRLNGDGSIWMQTCINGAGDFMVNRYVPKN